MLLRSDSGVARVSLSLAARSVVAEKFRQAYHDVVGADPRLPRSNVQKPLALGF